MALITLQRAFQAHPQFSNCDSGVLENILNAVSASVVKYCNRDFTATDYDELYSGQGDRFLLLNQMPVISVSRVACNPSNVLTCQYTSTTASRATVSVTSSGLSLSSVTNGTTTTTPLTFASNATITSLAAAVSAVSGWTGTVQGSYGGWASADLKAIQGGFNALNRATGLTVHVSDLDHWSIDEATGELWTFGRWVKGRKNYRVSYRAGFTSVPEPIQQACAELAAVVYGTRSGNPAMQSESLGAYSYTRAATASLDQLSLSSKAALNAYKLGHSIYANVRY